MSLLADLNARYTDTAFRLELLQHYGGADHGALRSIHNDPYLRRVAEHTLAGKQRDRVHVVAQPHTDYMTYELDRYRDNVAVGEHVLIAPAGEAAAELEVDFWLFDEDTDHPEAAVMHYDSIGDVQHIEHVTDPARLAGLRRQAQLARGLAIDLGQYLADLADHESRRAG